MHELGEVRNYAVIHAMIHLQRGACAGVGVQDKTEHGEVQFTYLVSLCSVIRSAVGLS
jgi:hypothetical protein